MAGRAIQFPSKLRPTRRQFRPGQYQQSIFRAQNGASVAVRFGDTPFDARLSLTFANISDQDARKILQNYDQVNGQWDYVEFPNDGDMIAGVGDTLMSRYLRGTQNKQLKYRYAEPPTVSYVFMDVCTVTCEFIGYLDGGLD
jgi:hypothetical protein